VLYWSGICYVKLIFLKLTFTENLFCLKNIIWIYVYTVELTHWTALKWSFYYSLAGWSRHTCIPKGFIIIAITSFLQLFS